MLYKLRRRAEEEKGFTLIELLVVILIIGILAAIAIPSFLNQKGKANDATAKSQVKTLQTAVETYATDHNGDYSGLGTGTPSVLYTGSNAIEPTLGDTSSATWSVVSSSTSGYTIKSTSNVTGDAFTITNNAGVTSRTCSAGTGAGQPGGCVSGTW
jgi:type IV pilus assembly protein PilA